MVINKDQSKDKKRIATLDSIRAEDPRSDEDHDHPQSFFAGGSKASGIMIEGNNGDGEQGASFAQNIINRMSSISSMNQGLDTAFDGAGHRLTDRASTSQQEVASRYITIYSNGFAVGVNDPDQNISFYSYQDPQNRQILQSIMEGHAPPNVLQVNYAQRVDVKVLNKSSQDYKEDKMETSFQGAGHRLGSVASPVIQPQEETQTTRYLRSLNRNLPMTNIQIRLMDGSRLVGSFNLSHTVHDIREFISLNNPTLGSVSYVLQTSIPGARILKDSETIEEAGLVNVSVVQRRLE